jgi:hypothetical protein
MGVGLYSILLDVDAAAWDQRLFCCEIDSILRRFYKR